MDSVQEKEIRIVFIISLILKGIGSLVEIMGGIVFFFTGTITALFSYLIRIVLFGDPTVITANEAQHFLPYFLAHSKLFGTLYLLSHGIIKIFLIVNLLRGKLWAFPAMLWVLTIFITYQLYQFSYSHSVFLCLLTIFDAIVFWLIWHEYKIAKQSTH